MVPLKEAWVSGAKSWTAARREAFANDLTRPQLIAVTDNLNQSKGDKDPAEWVPPLSSYVCTYVRAYVRQNYLPANLRRTLTRASTGPVQVLLWPQRGQRGEVCAQQLPGRLLNPNLLLTLLLWAWVASRWMSDVHGQTYSK